MIPRLIGHCHGQIMLRVHEDQFPAPCDWIEPIATLAPYVLVLAGAAALASITHSLHIMWRVWRLLRRNGE